MKETREIAYLHHVRSQSFEDLSFSVLHFSKRLRQKQQKVINSISLNKNMNQDSRPQQGEGVSWGRGEWTVI